MTANDESRHQRRCQLPPDKALHPPLDPGYPALPLRAACVKHGPEVDALGIPVIVHQSQRAARPFMREITMIQPLIVIALALWIATPIAAAQDHSDIEQIRSARAEYNDAIARHDVTGIVSFLDEEYQITTSLGQLLQDRDGEAAAWQALIESRENLLYVRSPESIEISSDYPLAAELGTWVGTWSTEQGEIRTGGRYAAMWRQVDGVWKVRSELFVALYCNGASCP